MEHTRKPNIIWIMADDLSWADLGCYGQDKIKTPNIDRLAAEGIRFTQCYSGSTVCAPSRSSLMQGLHQGHATVRNNGSQFYVGPLNPDDPGFEEAAARADQCHSYRHCLQAEDVTVAEVLKSAGYATGQFGKWGLAVGDQICGLPNNKGFDEFFGYLNQRKAHNYYPEQLWHNRERVHYPQHRGHDHQQPNPYDADGRIVLNGVATQEDLKYSFDQYADAALTFVRAHADEPFFLYLPFTPPHGALEVPDLGEYTDGDWPTVELKVWAAMITRMDAAIGRLMSLIKTLGLDEDTLVFFNSDNGFSAYGYIPDGSLKRFFRNAGPWKGRKGNLHQGGVRVPCVARWPGTIAPGQVSDQVWAFWDLMATATDIAGVAPPERCDGLSILPTLRGNPDKQAQHEFLYWEHGNAQAARIGDWYAHRETPDAEIVITHANDDPREEHNMASEHPEILQHAARIFATEHEPNPYFRSPGERAADWVRRARIAGAEFPQNVDTW